MDIANTPSSGSDNSTSSTNSSIPSPSPSPVTPNSTSSSLQAKNDPVCEYVAHKNEGSQNVFTCLFCANCYRGGGINRMKQHLAGVCVTGQVASCKKVSHDVRHRMAESLKECSKKKTVEISDVGEDEVEQRQANANSSIVDSSVKKRKALGSIYNYFADKTARGSQSSIQSAFASKEAKHNVKMLIAEWAIVNCIPFNAFDCPLFQKVVTSIASIGPGFKAFSAYDLKTNLLSDWKEECRLVIESHRAKWNIRGCTLMADCWTDVRQRTLINFLVYSTHGIVFVKSVDASSLVKDAKTLFNLFSEVIEWIGPSNIVHVVTDNAANYVACGKMIKEKYRSIYWSPCAGHCLNLVLKDISSMPHVSALTTKASKIMVFVQSHMVFLSWLRKRPGWKEIMRPKSTRFATAFITLHNIYMHKQDLQALVIDDHFLKHKLSRTATGVIVSAIILDNQFWNDCYQIVKITSPLVKLLRIVDSDEKPSLPYVYEGMRRAKNGIKQVLNKNKELYKSYTQIIQSRWDRHLKTNLHATAYILNPALIYSPDGPARIRKRGLMSALFEVLEATTGEGAYTIMKQVIAYIDGDGPFSKSTSQIAAHKLDPHEWWIYYGNSVPELQHVALRVLSQTSSSGCERNWSLFEHIHTKRRNRLEHARLNDLVFTNYNLRLKHRTLLKQKKSYFNPIDYESIDDMDCWVVEEDLNLISEFDDADEENLEGHLTNEDVDTSSTARDIPEPSILNDDVAVSAFKTPNISVPTYLNELCDDFDFY